SPPPGMGPSRFLELDMVLHASSGPSPRPDRGRIAARSAAIGLWCALALAPAVARAERKLEYNRDIRPILSENCFLCHGPDKGTRKAGLRPDRREVAVDELGVIVPGQPEESELVFRITSDDPTELMPQPKSTKTLTVAEKELIQRWIKEGAEYQPHWSY